MKKTFVLLLCAVMVTASTAPVGAETLSYETESVSSSTEALSLQEENGESQENTADTNAVEKEAEDTELARDNQDETDLDASDDAVDSENTENTDQDSNEAVEEDKQDTVNDAVETTNHQVTPGWNQTEGGVRYYESDGVTYKHDASKPVKIGDKYYYFNSEGYLQTGWQKVNGRTYYFNPSGSLGTLGAAYTGVRTVKGYKYDFHVTYGFMMTGWKKINGNIYYFWPSNGRMITGWKKIDGKNFYFNGAGKRVTGWKKIDNKIYYFKTSGKVGDCGQIYTGLQTIKGQKYYFQKTGRVAAKGAMVTGAQKISGKIYFFRTNGRVGTRGQMQKGKWVKDTAGKYYYLNSKGVAATGWLKLNGYYYYFDKSTGQMATGWKYISTSKASAKYSSYKFYFRTAKSGSARKGSLVQDVSSIIGAQSSYYAEVDRTRCTVTIYAKDSSGQYRIPVKTMTCSVGLPSTPTPAGTYTTSAKYRWKELMGPSWGQYATRIVGGVLFHSVAGSAANSYSVPAVEYNKLGTPASHGCVRLNVRDAKWIYDNCQLGMTVRIGDNLYAPFDKPNSIYIPASQNYDPTDPAV